MGGRRPWPRGGIKKMVAVYLKFICDQKKKSHFKTKDIQNDAGHKSKNDLMAVERSGKFLVLGKKIWKNTQNLPKVVFRTNFSFVGLLGIFEFIRVHCLQYMKSRSDFCC